MCTDRVYAGTRGGEQNGSPHSANLRKEGYNYNIQQKQLKASASISFRSTSRN